MRTLLRTFAALAACLAPLGASAGEILNLGDAAPPLAVSGWVKGEKVERFEPGKTYVVEFWATWCGPCRATIPHLTELAHKYKDKDVRFVGVDIWEQDQAKVKPFVEEMGDKMNYSVALDEITDKSDPAHGAMSRTWMKAAEENGIPTAFVVHDGKLAWIGHPREMDEPLAKIRAGDWDPSKLARARLVEKTKERKASVIRQKVIPLYRNGDYKAVLAALDEATSGDPELAEQFELLKFAALCNGGDTEAGLAFGEKLMKANMDDPSALNNFAWNVIDPKLKNEVDPRLAQFALWASRRAVELTHEESPTLLDTFAEALFRTGDINGAIATEEKALKRLEPEVKDKSVGLYKVLTEQLERFRKAASEKKDRP